MMKLAHYIKRSWQVGFKNTLKIAAQRGYAYGFDRVWRSRATRFAAAHTWEHIMKHEKAPQCEIFAARIAQQTLYSLDALGVSASELLYQADETLHGSIALLGSTKKQYGNQWPWHVDIRLQSGKESAAAYDASLYYKDIEASKTYGFEPGPDIKVPWELGRLHHISVLAYAYHQTKNADYRSKAKEIWQDFAANNPFLLGVNWACPMDVGIRAANMVFAAHCLMDDDYDFWQSYAAAIYDHLFYLEHNWEVYDGVTSNHYLADLVGYLYCCWFFQSLPTMQERITWCCNELLREFDKQVFYEGTDYEGSSSYHRMVTEFFYHFSLLAQALAYPLSADFHEKLGRMIQFAQDTTFGNGEWMQIGDNDSGRLLFGLTPGLLKRASVSIPYIKRYCDFGLTVARHCQWHYSLRHAHYNQRQPSGHFHHDAGSVTVAYKGIPIIVDPGTYLYTPSVAWRNYFRASSAHSLMSVKKGGESLDDRLFMLDMPYTHGSMDADAAAIADYTSGGNRARRSVIIDNDTLCIEDIWIQSANSAIEAEWRFILHPVITPEISADALILHYEGKPLVALESDLSWQIYETWYSPSYGVKQPTYGLYAESIVPLECTQSFVLRPVHSA